MHVEQSLVLLQPHLHSPGGVDAVGVLVPGEAVRVEGPEDVSHPAAGDDLQDSPTLPYSEGHLQVFSAPDVHLLVITPEIPERLPGHREQSWRERRE